VVVEKSQENEEIEDIKVCLECNRQFTGIVAACPHDGSPLVKVMQDPLVGTNLAGKYEIISVVGRGGMGVVYKARDTIMDRLVAIKMLKAQLISDSMSVKRFHQEGKAASRINHPHVITVHEFGISPSGQPFIVMDFLEGTSLAQVIKDDGQVGVDRTVKILSQACDALNHAHRHGVVHRDLKPSNIVLIDYDGQKDFVKVVDFGVAKLITGAGQDLQRLTQAGEVCGSPVYMSPEQCQGDELDARSDIYSMGVVIYESLTGKLPLIGQTMVETMSKHITDTAPPFNEARPDLYIPGRLEAVVFRALSKSPDERHSTMTQLKQDLELAIPKPGRSQVLRSVPPEGSARASGSFVAQHLSSKLLPLKAFAAGALIIIGGALFFKLALGMGSAVQTTVSPVKSKIETPASLSQPQTAVQRPPAAVPSQSPTSATVIDHAQVEPAKVNQVELVVPKIEHNQPRVQLQKPAVPLEPRKTPEAQRTSVSTAPPLRRKAYSTLAGESAIHQRSFSKTTGDSFTKHADSRHEKKNVAHHTGSDNQANSSKGKGNSDPFDSFRKMYSYKHDW
jgi:eukaryotic-like serine/threonine-protein kinase